MSDQPTPEQRLSMECRNIRANVVVVDGIIRIVEQDIDHKSEVYMEYDEATALRDWLNKVLS